MTLAELAEVLLDVLRRLVTLAALPETQHPLRVEAGLTRQCAVTGNNLVEVTSGNKVVVHVLGHLAPDA